MRTGFIGTGNMGGALIKGMAESDKDHEIFIYDKNPDQVKKYETLKCVSSKESMEDLIKDSDIIVLSVKPNIFDTILPKIKGIINNIKLTKIFVSIAAGISLDYMNDFLGTDQKIVRAMPNLNSMLGLGMAALSKNDNVSDAEFHMVKDIFTASGKAVEINESLMDTVIGVSGSSPAYAYMYMDALIDGAVKNGMAREDALIFAAQSTMGAAVMVMESGIEPATLVDNVCSPGGTTIEAVTKLREEGFKETIEDAMQAAIDKSKKMTK